MKENEPLRAPDKEYMIVENHVVRGGLWGVLKTRVVEVDGKEKRFEEFIIKGDSNVTETS